MNKLVILLVVLLNINLISNEINLIVTGHAVLKNPTPYNINPTTNGPCGVNQISETMQSTPMATWTRGSSVCYNFYFNFYF